MINPELLQTKKRIMAEFIRRQYAANDSHSLDELASFDGAGYTVHRDLLTFLLTEREAISQVIAAELEWRSAPQPDTLLAQFVDTTTEFIHQNNQFIHLIAPDQARLASLYREYMQAFAQFLARDVSPTEALEAFQGLIERHFIALGAFVQSLGRRLGEALITTQVVNAEYPLPLQLELLGLDPNQLIEPILDVGCGRNAALVKWLRQAGHEAYGLDAAVLPSPATFRGDWLAFDFSSRAWGTVLSHMAFSNHFLFHHLNARGAPVSYAQKYMQILRALKAGGQFCYAPGLPFMEGLLPRPSFAVQVRRLELPADFARFETTYARLLGQSPMYATKVTRL